MSILNSLLRWIDPVQHRIEQEDRRRVREVVPPEIDADDVDLPTGPRDDRRPLLACRICDHQGQDAFCPRCLAQTMERPRRRP